MSSEPSPTLSGVAVKSQSDRIAIIVSLLGISALSWLYLWFSAARMGAMAPASKMDAGGMMSMSIPYLWDGRSLSLTFLMWAIMMVGMMVPSAIPAVVHYGSLVRKHNQVGSVLPSAWLFVAGYLFVWAIFSLAATFLQTALQHTLLLSPMMVSSNKFLTGTLLIAAGIYQWLPVKNVCLEKCRSPLQFFLFHWRPGRFGAVRMGIEHGLFCLGCCWALMLLLFVAGVMNLLWIALIAGLVFVEKLVPKGLIIGRITGVIMLAAGAYTLIA